MTLRMVSKFLYANSKFFLFALCAFSVGTWVGYYYLRESYSIRTSVDSKEVDRRKFNDEEHKGAVISEVEPLIREEWAPVHTVAQATGTCVPRNNIMFLKTHKTASSAVQNVLLRYGEKHDLTVGVSNNNDIRFRYGRKFHISFVRPTVKPINIICHHMVFNYEQVKKLMPEDTSFITILREPGSLFESTFDYMHADCAPFSRVKKLSNAMEYWLNHTSTFFHGKGDGVFWWFAKNHVFFDMGYDNLNNDDQYINNAITELQSQFQLVLLSDYFEESMLLLKDLLCWNMNDIASLKINARSTKNKLSDRVVNKIRAWNKADAAVYDHFNQTFWKRVAEYGHERMENDLKVLRRLNAAIQDNCIEGGPVSNKFIKDRANKVYNPHGVVMTGYNLKESAKKNRTCVNLLKGEIQWTREIMIKQARLSKSQQIANSKLFKQ